LKADVGNDLESRSISRTQSLRSECEAAANA